MDASEKVRGLHHLQVPCKESLLRMKLFKGKKLADEQKQKEMEEKKQKK